MRITKLKFEDITKRDFERFVKVQRGGRTNMMNVSMVSALGGPIASTGMAIITGNSYERLAKKYPTVLKA